MSFDLHTLLALPEREEIKDSQNNPLLINKFMSYAIKVSIINVQGDEEECAITPMVSPEQYEVAKSSVAKVISQHVINKLKAEQDQ